jgi:hypothetical protein
MGPDQTEEMGAAPVNEGGQEVSAVAIDSGNIEEGGDAYRPGGFHPVYIGEVYAGKYEIMNKIGYGLCSTVWLVKDLSKS